MKDSKNNGYNLPSAPLGWYAALTVTYLAGTGLFLWLAPQLGVPLPDSIAWWDMFLLAVASHKISWLVTKDAVLSWIRAPFAQFQHWEGPGAVTKDSPRGSGLRYALGMLLTCPWCLNMWVAGMLVLAFIVLPTVTRLVSIVFMVLMAADFLHFVYIAAGNVTQRSKTDHN